MKKTVNLKVEDVDKEWNETLQAIPSIREQLYKRIDSVVLQEEVTDQDMDNLETVFKCIKDQLAYFPSTILSYVRRCGKIPGLDTSENLDRLKEIRESAELEMDNIDSIKESVFRKLSLKRMQNGVFVLPSQPDLKPEPPKQKDAPAPDEESGE